MQLAWLCVCLLEASLRGMETWIHYNPDCRFHDSILYRHNKLVRHGHFCNIKMWSVSSLTTVIQRSSCGWWKVTSVNVSSVAAAKVQCGFKTSIKTIYTLGACYVPANATSFQCIHLSFSWAQLITKTLVWEVRSLDIFPFVS